VSRASLPLETYAEPLDLLLDEVRRQNITLEEVALAPLVARYLDYMQRAVQTGQPLAIDWILLAATLIQWKSCELLTPATDTPADPVRDELVEQLRAHRREVAGGLGRRRAEEADHLSREGDPDFHKETPAEEAAEPPFISVWDLTQQARDLARWAAQRRQELRHSSLVLTNEPMEIPVAKMIDYLLAQVATTGPELNASRLLAQQSDLPHRISLFLALLEMAQSQQLHIHQPEEFAEIMLLFTPAH
jgi:chromatin segregation and condensation protein Rec8/ScpA/Scc1 (kleisin family)